MVGVTKMEERSLGRRLYGEEDTPRFDAWDGFMQGNFSVLCQSRSEVERKEFRTGVSFRNSN